MNYMKRWQLSLCLFSFCFLNKPGVAISGTTNQIAGVIVSVTGPVNWRLNRESKAVALNARADSGRILHAGESLRCDRGGIATIQLIEGRVVLRESPDWFTVAATINSGEVQNGGRIDSVAERNQSILSHYSIPAGRQKQLATLIYSPADQSAIRPEEFLVLWNPTGTLGDISVVLQDSDEKTIWQQNSVRGTAGRLTSVTAKEALRRYRDDGGLRHEVRLSLRSSTGSDMGVAFTLLSKEREEMLDKELAANSEGAGVLLHIVRAYIFDSFRELNRVAEEYDIALKSAPLSQDLLLAAVEAHARCGDFSVARRLSERLPADRRPLL